MQKESNLINDSLEWEMYKANVIGFGNPTDYVFKGEPKEYPCIVKSFVILEAHKEIYNVFFYYADSVRLENQI